VCSGAEPGHSTQSPLCLPTPSIHRLDFRSRRWFLAKASVCEIMYNYQVTAHKASAVSHSLVGHFTSSASLSLVVRYVLLLRHPTPLSVLLSTFV